MKLEQDSLTILRHAWSIRLMLLAALLSALEVGLNVAPTVLHLPPLANILIAAASTIVTGAAFIARFVVQKQLEESAIVVPKPAG